MPLIPCPDCGRQISDRAQSCLECGAPIAAGPHPVASASPATREVIIANQKYFMPALVQSIIPLPGLGQFIKGHSHKGKELMLGTIIWVPGLMVLAAIFPPIAPLALLFALLFFLYSWGKAVLDAYNSHDDDVKKMIDGADKAEADKKAA